MWEDDATKKAWNRAEAVFGEDSEGNIVPDARPTRRLHMTGEKPARSAAAFSGAHDPVRNKGYMSKAPVGGGHADGHAAPRGKTLQISLPRARHAHDHDGPTRHPHG